MTAARLPRDAPTFYVQIMQEGASTAIRVDVSDKVIAFTFDDEEKKASKFELELDNYDLLLFDDPIWKKGNILEVSWGYAGNMTPAQTGVIQKISGFKTMKVEALARSILMNKLPKSRIFENMKHSDVARLIASENGYPASQQTIDDTEVMLPVITQARLTDAQFIRSIANKEGFEFSVDSDGFHFHRRNMGQRPVRTFIYFIDPGAGDIIDINVENDVTAKPGAVTAKGRDPLEKKDISETANNENTKRDVLAPVIEVVDQKTGETSLQKNTAAEATTLTNAPNAAAAKREADGRFINAQQTTNKLTVHAVGDPLIRAKQVIEIQNISRRLSGRYYITASKHKLSATEYTMEMKVRSDGSGGIGGTKNTKSDGSVNTKDPSDPNALVPKEVVDPKTGETTITYVRGGAS